MKNLFLGLFMLAGTAMFANNSAEIVSESKQNSELIQNSEIVSAYDKVLGWCNIKIVNRLTGEIVYEIDLPANSQEACNHMAQNTLDAYVAGKLK